MVNIDKGARVCVIVLRLVEGKLFFCAPSKHKVFLLAHTAWLEMEIQL